MLCEVSVRESAIPQSVCRKTAILNRPTPALDQCELTFIDRSSIHLKTAQRQHSDYASALRRAGVQVDVLDVNQTFPDAVFVEDVAVILDEMAVVASMGNPIRRAEIPAMAEIIAGFRPEIRYISLPATIEGGDVLRVGRTLFVGESPRTNRAGITALEDIAGPFGYEVVPVKVHGCLHLKTGITALDDETFIHNPAWVDTGPFQNYRRIEVGADEPWAANVLRIGNSLIVNACCPRTADYIDDFGFTTERVDISEFGKAEAGLTCMSLVFDSL